MKYLIFNRLLPFSIFAPVIFASVGYLISLIVPMTITLWSIIFLMTCVFCIGILVRFRPIFVADELTTTPDDVPLSRRMIRWALMASPFIILLPGLYATLTDTWTQVMFHGDLHTSIINQIHHGIFPPINPKLPNEPLGYYWLYHAFLAVTSYIFNLASPFISALLNLVSLICTIFWIGAIFHELGFKRKFNILFSLMILFVLFSGNLFGVFHAWDAFFTSPLDFSYPPEMILSGDERLYGLWSKYLNFNSFPLSIMYFMSGIYAIIRFVKGDMSIQTIFLYSFGIIGGVVFQLATGTFLMAVTIPTLGLLYLIQLINRASDISIIKMFSIIRQDIVSTLQTYSRAQLAILIGGHVVIYLSTLIYGLINLSAFSDILGSSNFGSLNFDSSFSYMYPLVIFFVISAVLIIRQRNIDYTSLIVSTIMSFVITYIFAFVLTIAEANQYKFVYLTALFLSLSITYLVREFIMSKNQTIRYISVAIFGIIMTLIFINITMINIYFLQRTLENRDSFVYDGRLIGWGDAHEPLRAWIRDETPIDTIIIRIVEYDTLFTSMFTERLPYVGFLQFKFESENDVTYQERFDAVELFFNEASTINQRIQAVKKFREFDLSPNVLVMLPDYLVIPEDELEQLGLSFAFESEGTRLYWLRHNGKRAPLVYTNATPSSDAIFTIGDDETIQVMGVKTNVKETIVPCESFWVTTWWRATQLQSKDYLMKLVLVDPDSGEAIANSDAVPSATFMTEWMPNTLYTDTRYIDVPCDIEAGEYLLLMGMYEIDYDTLEFVADLQLFYQGAGVGELGFIKTLQAE